MVYLPARQSGRTTSAWVLRVQGDLEGAMELARQAVREVSPSTPVRGVELLDERSARSVPVPR